MLLLRVDDRTRFYANAAGHHNTGVSATDSPALYNIFKAPQLYSQRVNFCCDHKRGNATHLYHLPFANGMRRSPLGATSCRKSMVHDDHP